MTNFINVPAIHVSQPFGDFYITSIPISKLIEVCYSFPAVYGDNTLNGIQRGLNEKRIKNIAEYCSSGSALFPNTIILSTNISKDGSLPEDDIWYIDDSNHLIAPTNAQFASIVDGQHRLQGLQKAYEEGTLSEDFDLVCAVYFELTAPQQAEVFATINFNQQKVDKSLAYQLFGYDLDSTESEQWAPDTLAIYFSRLLNNEKNSPFYNRIHFGMKKLNIDDDPSWTISTATIVEGVTNLISTNPTVDRYKIHKKKLIRNTRSVLKDVKSIAPLREEYIANKDTSLYELVFDYFDRWKALAWGNNKIQFMHKTIGIQASFDILKVLANQHKLDKGTIISRLNEVNIPKLEKLQVNFSGIGRAQIRNEIKEQLKI